MRITRKRFAVILALATAGALAVAGVAMGSGNSTATINFTPSNLPTRYVPVGAAQRPHAHGLHQPG